MNKNKWGMTLAVVSAGLMLLTTYMALYYAPIPQTSVGAADEILSSVVGSEIRIAGFVVDFSNIVAPSIPDYPIDFAFFYLADFVDYQRYVSAASANLSGQWWTIEPIPVVCRSHLNDVANGTNVSVFGSVGSPSDSIPSAVQIPPDSYWLSVASSEDVEIGSSAGEFGVLSAPIAQKIFYFHMPSAWVSYLAFFFTLVFGALVLRTKDMKYDRWAAAAAELGVLFATIAIATGPIWAKQEWGVYWRWNDTKLVTTFILWLVYIGYLMLRASIPEPSKRARVAGVYGVIGFVTVPMSLLSARIAPLLNSSHPVVIASSSGSLSPEAGMTIGIAVVAFTVLFITMLIKRVEIAESEEELEELKRSIGGEE